MNGAGALIHVPLDRFFELHDLLEERTSINEATRLANSVVDPKTADAKKIWRVIWDKPLFTDRSHGTAENWIDGIKAATNCTQAKIDSAWQTWGNPSVFNIRRVRESRCRSDDCFEVEGEEARRVVSPDLKIPPLCRLYPIQGAAKAMRARTERRRRPFEDLPDRNLSEIVSELKEEFGWGWGDATVLHALTDMGLAIKPDRHVKNTMKELGLECEDSIKINEAAGALLDEINASERANARFELRYLDKVLMDISRVGIIPRRD